MTTTNPSSSAQQRSPGVESSSSVVVRAKNLRKDFGPVRVLKDVNFDIGAGEMVCVWGPSGAGKSTLLHVAGLMTPPSGGELELFGRNVSMMTDQERTQFRSERIGFLFQFHHLLPDFSLLENVMMPLLIRRWSRAAAEQKARPLLERLGLGARLQHRPSEASGGEQQRAALARALAGEPGLLMADEPTGNLDRAIGGEVERLLKEETKARRTALILVTHNESLAAQADRRLVLVDGVLQE
jgi:lipoprotein-releasing system ATP-binding protein